MELFFLLRPSLTQEARKTIGRRRPSATFSDAFSASNGPIHSQPPLSYPVRAAADSCEHASFAATSRFRKSTSFALWSSSFIKCLIHSSSFIPCFFFRQFRLFGCCYIRHVVYVHAINGIVVNLNSPLA